MTKSFIFYVSNASQLVSRFVQMIVITRYLSPVDLGVYYSAVAYPQLLSRVFDFGLPHAVRYFILQSPAAGFFIVRMVLLFSLLVTLPILIIFYFLEFLPLESYLIIDCISGNFIVLTLYCVLLIVNSIFNAIIISFEDYRALLLSSTIPYLIFIVVVIVQFYRSYLDVNGILLQLLISELVILFIYSLFTIRKIKQFNVAGIPGDGLKIFKYALQIYPSGLLKVLTTRLDKVILSFIADPVFIGYYSVLMAIRDVSIFPITSYGQVFMNKLSRAVKGGVAGIQRMIDMNLVVIFAIYVGGFLMYLMIPHFALSLFFRDLTDEIYQAAFYLFISIIPLALFSFLSNVFLTINKPRYISYSSLISVAIFYIFILSLYKLIGANSFFYASILSTISAFIYLFIYYKILIKRKYYEV